MHILDISAMTRTWKVIFISYSARSLFDVAPGPSDESISKCHWRETCLWDRTDFWFDYLNFLVPMTARVFERVWSCGGDNSLLGILHCLTLCLRRNFVDHSLFPAFSQSMRASADLFLFSGPKTIERISIWPAPWARFPTSPHGSLCQPMTCRNIKLTVFQVLLLNYASNFSNTFSPCQLLWSKAYFTWPSPDHVTRWMQIGASANFNLRNVTCFALISWNLLPLLLTSSSRSQRCMVDKICFLGRLHLQTTREAFGAPKDSLISYIREKNKSFSQSLILSSSLFLILNSRPKHLIAELLKFSNPGQMQTLLPV